MNSSLKFAFIIPVYNAGDYLSDCLNSILKQTYTNFKVYCVDDGSSDNSLNILNNFKNSDLRVVVFHKKNGGVASARNYALDNICDEDWISFVDADDYVAPFYLEKLVKEINKLGNFGVDYVRLFPQRTNIRYSEIKEWNNYEYCQVLNRIVSIKEYFKQENVGGFVASIVVRADIVKNNNIRFIESMKTLEDQVYSIECAVHARSILIFQNKVYFYYSNPNSATMSTVDRSIDVVNCINNIRRIIEHTGDPDLKEYFKERFMPTKIRMLINERLRHFFSKPKNKLQYNINVREYNLSVVDKIKYYLLRLFNSL